FGTRNPSDAFQLRFALNIEAANALLKRVLDFLTRLAHPGERALGGIATSREYPIKFTARNNVETCACIGEQLQDRAIRVCFNRVTDQMVQRRERGVQAGVVSEECSRAVNISRRADFLRDAGKIDILAVEMPVTITERMHLRI